MGFLLHTNSTNFPAVMELPFSDTQNLFSTIPDVIVNINHGSLYQDVAPQRNLYHLRFPHHSACFWTVEAPRPFSWHNASLGIISVAIFLCLWEGFRVSRDNQNWMQPGWRWLLPRGIRELGEISQICPATKQKKKKKAKGKGSICKPTYDWKYPLSFILHVLSIVGELGHIHRKKWSKER